MTVGPLLAAGLTVGAGGLLQAAPLGVGFIVSAPPPQDSAEAEEKEAAWRWLSRVPGIAAERIRIEDLPSGPRFDVLWWHEPGNGSPLASAARRALRERLDSGAGLLLSLGAVNRLLDLGLESMPPNGVVEGERSWEPNAMFGLESYAGHPLLARFFGGVYTWRPSDRERYWRWDYVGDLWPQGRVIAVEKAHISIEPRRRVMWEHRFGAGRVLAVSSFLYFSQRAGRFRAHLEEFTGGALRWLGTAEAVGEKTSFWVPGGLGFTVRDRPLGDPSAANLRAAPMGDMVLVATGAEAASDQPWNLSGLKLLAAGTRRGRTSEVWAFPVRFLKDLDIGVRKKDRDPRWLSQPDRFEVSPHAIDWEFQPVEGTRVKLRSWVDRERPAMVLALDVDAPEPVSLLFRGRPELTSQWPRGEGDLGAIRLFRDPKSGWVGWEDEGQRRSGVLGLSRRARAWVGEAEAFANAWPTPGEAGQEGELREPLAAIEVEWRPGEQAPILVVAGGAIGIEASVVEATHVLSDAASSFLRAREETEALLSEAALVEGPDTAWNEAYRWAVAMLARFEVDSPGVGRGLMAGFEASRPGWFRARPGYAWYFGRDAVWTGFALDALGRFEMVERALDLLASYQEFTGKIFHELTPTGSIHYDAADATPLYLVALAHHLRWSGNLGFVRAHEEPARRALRFLRATDSDGDRLIENTEVGHGWIEGGKLHGGHTTFYLAGIGVEALRSAGELFEALGEPEEAARARDEAAEVRAILERDFWDSSAGAYFYSKLQDGSFRSAPTILPAVPMGFGWLDEERAAAYLDFLAGSDITADWGARILARSHPAYNPVGYHEGSVWPLFSGWAALAEYRHHRPESAFFHVAQTLATFRHGNLGAIEEVFRGDRYEPRGITSHQAWSESLPLQAVVEGMLGARPDALRHTLRLEPHLPPSWGNLRVSNLRVGQGLLALHVEEKSAGRVTCRLTGRGVARVELALAFPPGSRPLAVRRRGAPSPFRVVATRDDVHVEVVLEGLGSSETVEFDIDRGPSLEIPLPALIPGDPSRGLRFIRKRLGGGRFEVTLEGVAGQRYEVTAWDVQDRTVWEGAEVLGREGRRTRLAVDVPGSDGEYRRATLAALFDP